VVWLTFHFVRAFVSKNLKTLLCISSSAALTTPSEDKAAAAALLQEKINQKRIARQKEAEEVRVLSCKQCIGCGGPMS